MTDIKKTNWFDPDKAFFELAVVRCTFVLVIISAVVVACLILINGDYSSCFTSSCFNVSVSNFKVPLGVLSLLIPIIAVFAANHRSEQTKRQIELSQVQNNFSNYYKHLEEFEKYIHNAKPKYAAKTYEMMDARMLHNVFFPLAKDGHLAIDDSVKLEIKGYYEEAFEFIHGLMKLDSKQDDEETRIAIFNMASKIQESIKNLENYTGVKSYSNTCWVKLQHYVNEAVTGSESLQASKAPHLYSFLNPFTEFASLYTDVMKFTPNSKPPSYIEDFLTLSFNSKAKIVCSREQGFRLSYNTQDTNSPTSIVKVSHPADIGLA
ncbi:hypothetical protein [Thalassotalea agarivorans]|uniref:Phage abortive infection protein n=1 Tax=Thalassotalea agarivorans TaxID=349064 RepID=A0A1I0E728_THASX|nr:hypothetical protein [Thalassotalea agarivorans]SET40440.1 hypothetical protein SAMN05660429_01739 [Thalassotalea agarivorans]